MIYFGLHIYVYMSYLLGTDVSFLLNHCAISMISKLKGIIFQSVVSTLHTFKFTIIYIQLSTYLHIIITIIIHTYLIILYLLYCHYTSVLFYLYQSAIILCVFMISAMILYNFNKTMLLYICVYSLFLFISKEIFKRKVGTWGKNQSKFSQLKMVALSAVNLVNMVHHQLNNGSVLPIQYPCQGVNFVSFYD